MNLIHVRRTQRHMATDFELVISTASARKLAAEQVLIEAHAEIARLEEELSEFLATSPVARLNASRPGERIAMPASAMELIVRSEALRVATEGAFNAAAKSCPLSERYFGWDVDESMAWKEIEGAHLGFGAIGKGYALDRVRAQLEREGFHDYCLVAGGSSILLSGFAAPGEPWRWAWSWKKDAEGNALGLLFPHKSGQTVALGVSGLHEKGAHLKDPRTGAAATAYQSSLIGYPRATEADALSTALFVAGWEKAMSLFDRLLDKPAMALIDAEGVPRWNGFFQKLWGAPGGSALSLVLAPLMFLTFFFANIARAEEGVDLSSMGMEDFTPYLFDRNPLWILLPALSLVLVFVHLKRKPRIGAKPLRTQKTLERVK